MKFRYAKNLRSGDEITLKENGDSLMVIATTVYSKNEIEQFMMKKPCVIITAVGLGNNLTEVSHRMIK